MAIRINYGIILPQSAEKGAQCAIQLKTLTVSVIKIDRQSLSPFIPEGSAKHKLLNKHTRHVTKLYNPRYMLGKKSAVDHTVTNLGAE